MSFRGRQNRKEIDLRRELERTLFGSSIETEKGYKVLVRKMRLDECHLRIACVCNHHGEGSSNPSCSMCQGEGYYWDESWATCFKVEREGSSNQLSRFIFPHNIDLNRFDRVIEVRDLPVQDKNVIPYERECIWKIEQVEEWRADSGRIEFIICHCTRLHYKFERDTMRRREDGP